MALHNTAAQYHHLNFLYKSFSVDNIEDAIKAMRLLKFRGAGITMPFKVEIIKYLDILTPEAQDINAVNTVLNEDGKLIGYNTDWISATRIIKREIGDRNVVILGNGGYARAVEYAIKKLGCSYNIIDRKLWHIIPEIRNQLVFNCTPVENIEIDVSNVFIDCLTSTETGKELAIWQAKEQFQLYTGKEFPVEWIKSKLIGII
jgi:shikimate 5-dehydrogenase